MKKEKIFNITMFILIFVTILSIILLKLLGNLDEMWNYNFARNVANGLVPYRNFNMLQMPLLPIICGLALKIITNQLFLMRILAALLCSIIIYIIYKIFNILNIKKEISIIFTFIIGYLFKDIFCIDYNWATLLLTLLIIFNEIKIYKTDKILLKDNMKSDLFLGIFAGLTVTLKQTSGILICVVLVGNKLLFTRNKEEFRTYLKSFIYRLIGILIPILLMLIYLICNSALDDFISYTIKGVSGFSNYISYKTLINFNIVGVLSIVIPISFIYSWYKSIIKEKDKNIYFLLVYGLAIFGIVFPISDEIHFLIGGTPIIILLLYEMANFFNKIFKDDKINKAIINFTLSIIILILIYYTFINFQQYFRNIDNYSELNHFKYVPISKALENQIKLVDNFILNSEKSIRILDASAAVYMIPIDKYNKDYDMLLKGNLGENGEEELIKDIKQAKDIQYLILKEKYSKNWQTPLEIIEYVEKNKNKVGEVGIFNIYE